MDKVKKWLGVGFDVITVYYGVAIILSMISLLNRGGTVLGIEQVSRLLSPVSGELMYIPGIIFVVYSVVITPLTIKKWFAKLKGREPVTPDTNDSK